MSTNAPTDGTVENDGLRLHYLDWDNTSAPAMLLLHGTASHARIWDPLAAALCHAFHIVALDQRGFGDSEWPPDYRTGYLPECWQSDVRAVISQLGLAPVILVGLSAGAATAMHYAAMNPAAVSRLIVVEMGPEAGRAGVARVVQSIPRREEFDSEEEGIQYLSGAGVRSDPQLTREHARHALKPLPDGRVALKGDPSMRRRDWRRPLRSVEENWAAVRSIQCPTLVIRGGESKLLTAVTAQRMAEAMQDCTLVTIEGAGHTVPLHRPVEFEAAVRRWLNVETPSR